MRVAYLCADPGIPVLGSKGASVHVQQIVRAFLRRGDTVTVYCTRRGDGDPEALGGARIIEHGVPGGDVAERERAVAKAADALATRAADDGCDLIYERYSLFSDAAAQVGGRIGVPSVVEVNAPLIEEQRTHRSLVDGAGAEASTQRLFSHASVVACVSGAVACWASSRGARAPLIAPNGVDTRSFSSARFPDGPLRVVFLGSLKPWHGVGTAIDALAGLDGVEFTVLGDGPEREALEQRAVETGASVRWLGAVPHARVAEVLAGMHVGVAPYPAEADDYFSPLKVYEYLAAGLAIVASDCGQLPAILTHGRNGLLVPPGDPRELRRAVRLLRDDRDLARALGTAAREQAVERHDWDRVLAGILGPLTAEGHARSRSAPSRSARTENSR